PAGCRVQQVLGYETGPCNVLLDALMRQVTGGREAYDPGGKHAGQGRGLEPLLRAWLAHPYPQRRPPQGGPPPTFGAEVAAAAAVREARQRGWGLHALLCTATHFVARGITTSLRRFLPGGRLPGRVLLSGGGARNGLLWHLLEQQLAGAPLDRTDGAGVPADARQAP